MAGTILLDLDTILNAPKFFALFALVERAAGRRIIVVDGDSKRKDGEKLAAGLGISLHRYVQCLDIKDKKSRHEAKTTVARSLRDKAPVIWIDLDLGDWAGEDLSKLSNIITLNWAAVLTQGVSTEGAASA